MSIVNCVYDANREALLADASLALHLQAYLEVVVASRVGGWSHATPCERAGTKVPEELFRINVANWLVLSLQHTRCADVP